jgi:hypothetical protein
MGGCVRATHSRTCWNKWPGHALPRSHIVPTPCFERKPCEHRFSGVGAQSSVSVGASPGCPMSLPGSPKTRFGRFAQPVRRWRNLCLIPICDDPDSPGGFPPSDKYDSMFPTRRFARRRDGVGTALQITRTEHTSGALRALASKCRDGAQVRRLSALAMVLDGHPRSEAASSNGMDRQTLRDWVHRYNAAGVAGLKTRPVPG